MLSAAHTHTCTSQYTDTTQHHLSFIVSVSIKRHQDRHDFSPGTLTYTQLASRPWMTHCQTMHSALSRNTVNYSPVRLCVMPLKYDTVNYSHSQTMSWALSSWYLELLIDHQMLGFMSQWSVTSCLTDTSPIPICQHLIAEVRLWVTSQSPNTVNDSRGKTMHHTPKTKHPEWLSGKTMHNTQIHSTVND